MEDYLKYVKCYGKYAVTLFAGWELAKGDWWVALPALAVAAYLAYTCCNKCCNIK
tara:strand:- start:15 stop:179 length:165 start_codon:yes stop_codon:yes gene_type:complete